MMNADYNGSHQELQAMYRSFTDRVLGGVCGGLGAILPLNAWWFRGLFALLSIVSTGVFAALYLLLWLALPQQSLVLRRRGGAGLLLLALVLTAATLAAWLLHLSGGLRGPSGEPLLWPGLLLALAVVFFLRQLRG
jgi:phage shock protein PspC (stress-responsive transcriptional regulator)